MRAAPSPTLAPVRSMILRGAALAVLMAPLAASAAGAPAHSRAPAHVAAPAAAARNAPRSIGKFDDWQAATHMEGEQTVCYAFTRASSSTPSLPGRGEVVLTVTERQTPRDAVAMSAGFPYAQGAEVQMLVDNAPLPFYTDKRNAFARDGRAVVTAFNKAKTAAAKSPGPRNTAVTDNFSLRGFSAAYAAIMKACPPK